MDKFIIVQDGDHDGEELTRNEAAEHIREIAEALAADATRLNRMALAIVQNSAASFWRHEGTYLDIRVEKA